MGDGVVLHMHVRRFVCDVRRCRRRIFTERLLGLVVPSARRTTRLHSQILATGFDLGGNPGVRHLRAEGVVISARTVLRLLRAAPIPTAGPVRVLGVDDWAKRKGRTFGTILVNLETHTVIDLLPDRTADTLAAWLRDHPEIEIVSRDRAGAYAEGIRRGAPQAEQVADRFHLDKNVTDALARYLTRKHAVLRQAAHGEEPAATERERTPQPAPAPLKHVQQERRSYRLARYEEVVALHRQSASAETIAKQVGMSPRTVYRWLQPGHFPERQRRTERRGQLAPFVDYLHTRWAAGCHNATLLWQELRARGYTGSYTSVAVYLAAWRSTTYRYRGQVQTRTSSTSNATAAYSPRQTCWLLLRPTESLDADDHAFLARLFHACPDIALVQALVEEFRTMLLEHNVDAFYTWLHKAETSGIRELEGIAQGIWRDRRAVEAAVRLDWSNGQVEGKVNKLKVIKRDMFGRSKFDLLRQRVLHAA
jgi:transposase